jgi:DegT/DnrJ/EryC1/StrS aminotransferase family
LDLVTGLAAVDFAHTMGARWRGRRSGVFGQIASALKPTSILNSGEGGLFVTTDLPDVMARAVMYSGCYMLYDRHIAVPEEEAFCEVRPSTPNYSGRMDNRRRDPTRATQALGRQLADDAMFFTGDSSRACARYQTFVFRNGRNARNT